MEFPRPDKHIRPHKIPLTPPNRISSNEFVDRCVGSLVGLAVGDALGASVEFRPHQYFVDHPVTDMEGGGTWGLDRGQWTDDTSMALCLASSLISRDGYDPYDQMVRYKWWYLHGYLSSTGECFDIGNATRDSIEKFINRQKRLCEQLQCRESKIDYLSWNEIQSHVKFDVDCSSAGVAGNGALMRLTPVPLFFYRHPQLAVEYAGRSGRLTHGDQRAFDACRYYAALIVAAVKGETKDELLDQNFYKSHQEWFGPLGLHPEILRVAQGSFKKKGGYDEGIRGKGYIVSALEAALWAFWSDGDSFETGALNAVNLGDDTDTTAAIYGQLAGACYGIQRIPHQWQEKLYAFKLLECVGQWLYAKGEEYKLTADDGKINSKGENFNTDSAIKYPQESRPSFSYTHSLQTNPAKDIESTRIRSNPRDVYRDRQDNMTYDSNVTQVPPRVHNNYQTLQNTFSGNEASSIYQRDQMGASSFQPNPRQTSAYSTDRNNYSSNNFDSNQNSVRARRLPIASNYEYENNPRINEEQDYYYTRSSMNPSTYTNSRNSSHSGYPQNTSTSTDRKHSTSRRFGLSNFFKDSHRPK